MILSAIGFYNYPKGFADQKTGCYSPSRYLETHRQPVSAAFVSHNRTGIQKSHAAIVAERILRRTVR